ncbi:hypothetical protein DPEC_G00106680 [Dallia pectoralis]|uniref:Uncharacterized protein n=1 Tax=Dallia pectoralis TaxID=75939 RepID=A0ACC2GY71_DALPE|nr:hypothetical protein DPEC_G00106680 [Dallia pectoralis]
MSHGKLFQQSVLCVSVFFICRVAAGLYPVSLIITPNRCQIFEYERFSLSCEVQGNPAGWRVWRNPTSRSIKQCGDGWGIYSTNCTITATKPTDSGVYWCQSESGETSDTVNITVTSGHVILESPALPVTEGHSVTLRCRYKTPPSNLTADFYKDGSFIRTETRGEMTIPVVNKSDEGWYWCGNSEENSTKSWMSVTASSTTPPPSLSPSPPASIPSQSAPPSPPASIPSQSPTPPVPDVSMSLSRLLCSLLVVSPYLVVSTVLMVKCYRSRA